MTNRDRKKYIEQIKTLPERLENLLRYAPDKKLDTPYGEGKWTVRQVVHHLADAHMNGFARLKWALTEDNPKLKTYEQDDWARLPDYNMPIESSLTILKGLHKRYSFLFKNLSDKDWSRTVDHPDPDYSNVEQLLKAYATHGEKHLEHIKRVIK